MFDFERLELYKRAKALHHDVLRLLKVSDVFDSVTKNQLRRASLSIILNIAEGTGKFSYPDKRNFYFTARGSVYECVAIFDVLKDEELISQQSFDGFYFRYEEISKMLFGLIQSLSKQR